VDILAGSYNNIDLVEPQANTVGSFSLYVGPYNWQQQTACHPTGATTEVRVENELLGDRLGFCVAFVGDIDEDGNDDIAASAIRGPYDSSADPEWTQNGRVYFFFSSDVGTGFAPSTLPTGQQVIANASNASIIVTNNGEGVRLGDRFGHAIAAVGDQDEGGTFDIAVGAPGSHLSPLDYYGRVFVISGEALKDAFDNQVQTLDLFLAGSYALNAAIVCGQYDGDGLDLDEDGDPLFPVRDRFGFSIAYLGEATSVIDYKDFAVGAPQFLNAPDLQNGGFVEIDLDRTGYVNVITDTGTHINRFNGEFINDRYGFCVAGQTDVAGVDSRSELIIGAPRWDSIDLVDPRESQFDVGKVYVVSATNGGSVLTQGVEIRGVQDGENLGHWVYGLPDVNGDSKDEFMAGSWRADKSQRFTQDPFPCSCQFSNPIGTADEDRLGGGSVGSLSVYEGVNDQVAKKYWGESAKDSAGNPSVYAPGIGPNGEDALIVGSARWPFHSEIQGVQVKEKGRVYVFLLE